MAGGSTGGLLDILLKTRECSEENLTTQNLNNELLLLLAVEEGRYGTLQRIGQTRCNAENVGVGLKETNNGGESNKFLKSTDHKESAVWHVAAIRNGLFFIEFMLVGFRLRITEPIYNKFLLATDHKDRTVWQVVTEQHQVDLSEELRTRLEIN